MSLNGPVSLSRVQGCRYFNLDVLWSAISGFSLGRPLPYLAVH